MYIKVTFARIVMGATLLVWAIGAGAIIASCSIATYETNMRRKTLNEYHRSLKDFDETLKEGQKLLDQREKVLDDREKANLF